VILFLACAGLVYSQVEVPAGALSAVRNAGIAVISNEIQQVNKQLTDAVNAFKPINATCDKLMNSAISKCGTCVESKCRARAESVCSPEEWQKVLGQTISFFKDGVPGFFSKTIPDVFVNEIGGGIVDISKDVGNFFENTIGGGILDFGKNFGNGVVDIGKDIGNGVVDIGKGIGNGVVDFGKTIGNGVVDVGKKIGDGFGKAIDGIKDVGNKLKDFGSSIGNAFSGLFGKREMARDEFIRTRRAGEPGCSQFENDAEAACGFYLSASYCADCGFNSDSSCPGYKAATDNIKAANAARKWITGIQKQNYDVLKMSFNPANMAGNGGFKDVAVSVNLFGKDLQFTASSPINPYIPNVAGSVIARDALAAYKQG